jgi:hypothetical protein
MFNSIKADGHVRLSERSFSEITPLRAFEARPLDYWLMNYFAIGPVLAPKASLNIEKHDSALSVRPTAFDTKEFSLTEKVNRSEL